MTYSNIEGFKIIVKFLWWLWVMIAISIIAVYFAVQEGQAYIQNVEENWTCNDIKNHIKEHGDSDHGFYLQQLIKKECSFP